MGAEMDCRCCGRLRVRSCEEVGGVGRLLRNRRARALPLLFDFDVGGGLTEYFKCIITFT